MEIQAGIPPTLPRANPTISAWQDPPDVIADIRSTNELPGSADIVVIGSGISGASVAFDLLTRDGSLKMVMLEARQACSGATGRNGRLPCSFGNMPPMNCEVTSLDYPWLTST
jgi:hypothetical protein